VRVDLTAFTQASRTFRKVAVQVAAAQVAGVYRIWTLLKRTPSLSGTTTPT
jgi:hypothetical protein